MAKVHKRNGMRGISLPLLILVMIFGGMFSYFMLVDRNHIVNVNVLDNGALPESMSLSLSLNVNISHSSEWNQAAPNMPDISNQTMSEMLTVYEDYKIALEIYIPTRCGSHKWRGAGIGPGRSRDNNQSAMNISKH